jgi:uncharacterized protein YjbJ (UPF0337 family)
MYCTLMRLHEIRTILGNVAATSEPAIPMFVPRASISGNTDSSAGMANKAAGKIKQGVGKAVGPEKLQGEGAGQEAKGEAQQLNGDAKNAVKGRSQQSRQRGK